MTSFNPERDKLICELWQAGKTSGQIALKLNVTRSTVMGVVTRTGLVRSPETSPRISLAVRLGADHTAMLDSICVEAGGATRKEMARKLLIAVLEDDAAAHASGGVQ